MGGDTECHDHLYRWRGCSATLGKSRCIRYDTGSYNGHKTKSISHLVPQRPALVDAKEIPSPQFLHQYGVPVPPGDTNFPGYCTARVGVGPPNRTVFTVDPGPLGGNGNGRECCAVLSPFWKLRDSSRHSRIQSDGQNVPNIKPATTRPCAPPVASVTVVLRKCGDLQPRHKSSVPDFTLIILSIDHWRSDDGNRLTTTSHQAKIQYADGE